MPWNFIQWMYKTFWSCKFFLITTFPRPQWVNKAEHLCETPHPPAFLTLVLHSGPPLVYFSPRTASSHAGWTVTRLEAGWSHTPSGCTQEEETRRDGTCRERSQCDPNCRWRLWYCPCDVHSQTRHDLKISHFYFSIWKGFGELIKTKWHAHICIYISMG